MGSKLQKRGPPFGSSASLGLDAGQLELGLGFRFLDDGHDQHGVVDDGDVLLQSRDAALLWGSPVDGDSAFAHGHGTGLSGTAGHARLSGA